MDIKAEAKRLIAFLDENDPSRFPLLALLDADPSAEYILLA